MQSFTNHTFVFIGGLHRSGTTLLAQCLADHPGASGLTNTGVNEDEGQHLQSAYPVARKHGGPGRFGFAPEMHMTEDLPLATEATRQELLVAWTPYWDCTRSILIEKSPPNMLKTRFLQAVFPGARFIIVMRHPIANSYATQKWSGTRLINLINHWLVCHKIMLADIAHLQHVTLLRYEDLVKEGDNELMRMHDFVGLDPQQHGLEPKAGLNDSYFSRWDHLKQNIGTSLYRELIVRRFEMAVNRFGYSLREPGFLIDRDVLLDRLIRTRHDVPPLAELTIPSP